MWILPKQIQSIISASAQVMKESDLDSEEFCQMSENSLMWRSKPSLSRTWSTRLKREKWLQHLFTRTLKPSHTESFEDKWTSLVEDSLANHSLKQVLKKQLMTQDTCSHTSQKESENANLELFSSKMSKESSAPKQKTENQFSNMSSEHWKSWVTEQRQEYSQRAKSAIAMEEECLIKERESLSLGWSTPTTMDSANIQSKRKKHNGGGQKPPLCQEVINYPTPSVAGLVEGGVAKNVEMTPTGFKATRENGTTYGAKLRDAVETMEQKNWATPVAMNDGMYADKSPNKNKRHSQGLATQASQNWATPIASEAKTGRTANQDSLGRQVKNWGTPKEQDSRAGLIDRGKHNLGETVHSIYNNTSSQDQTNHSSNGKSQESFRLNPSWVEQLMGLPVGWTQIGTELTDSDC